LKRVPQILLGRAFFAHELCLGVTHVSQRTLKKKTREDAKPTQREKFGNFEKRGAGVFAPKGQKPKA